MQKWISFLDVCRLLRWKLLGGIRPRLRQIESWEAIIEVSNLHLVSPALASCLHNEEDIPDNVRDYHEAVRLLSCEREAAMLDAFEIAFRTLNDAGIEPVLLKGAAHLVEGLYPFGARLSGDADWLIEASLADQALRALTDIGYRVSSEPLPDGHRHLPVLEDPASGLAIELHTRIEQEQRDPVFPISWFLQGARQVTFRGQRVRMFDPTQLFAQNFVHHRINDAARPSPIELRWLLDSVLIKHRHGAGIDWNDLRSYCVAAGHETTLATYLMFAEALFGQSAPDLGDAPDIHAMRKLREHVDPVLRPLRHDIDFVSWRFAGTDAVHMTGHCWKLLLPSEFLPGDTAPFDRLSRLELYQGEKKLGPAYSRRKVIERVGHGAYSHWGRELFFSMPDNSDPRECAAHLIVKGEIAASSDILSQAQEVPSLRSRSEEDRVRIAQYEARMEADRVRAEEDRVHIEEDRSRIEQARVALALSRQETERHLLEAARLEGELCQARSRLAEVEALIDRTRQSGFWRACYWIRDYPRRLISTMRSAVRRATKR